MGEWGYKSIILDLGTMEMSVIFTPRPLYVRYSLDGWPPEPVWTLWNRENILPLFVVRNQRNLENCSFASCFVECKTWLLTLRAEHRSKEFENRVLSIIFKRTK
jgi:hypothetical protein